MRFYFTEGKIQGWVGTKWKPNKLRWVYADASTQPTVLPPRNLNKVLTAAVAALGLLTAAPVMEGTLEDGIAAAEQSNYTQAYRLLMPLAQKGNAKAQYHLGHLYINGKGVAKNEKLAQQWWEKAAKQGYADAQYTLGVLHSTSTVTGDSPLARQWWEKAAKQGHAEAQWNLGIYFSDKQNYAAARQWWEKAAKQGHDFSQTYLGELYYEGKGVAQNYAIASQWWKKAAAQGDTKAQYNLGMLYENGQGVAQNYALARQWYEKASVDANTNAKQALQRLKSMGY